MDDESPAHERTLDHPPGDRGVPLAQFAPGTTLGHFRIVRELGAGGMGVVFEAHDPNLDRRVAIKLVRDRDAGSAAGARLIREAQAMARLSHPNVIPVHEVETVDGQVYVVMELVRGETLEAWLARPHTWREIVRTFVQAGEGLAAAHRAGLVHRDFKPSNVLVDEAGHVRVGDFGLARDDAGDRPEPRTRFAEGSDPTRPAGTPAYMAPEQRAGDVVDARADQFSFAISLERALDRVRVPRRVRSALGRALRADREARFPVLSGLLDELRRALDARRRTAIALSTGVAVAAITTAIAAWIARPAVDDCETGTALVDGLWNRTTRDAQAARFASVRPTAAVASTGQALDEWADAWRLGRRTACAAEPTQRAARLACLDRDLAELRAQLGAWSLADAAAVDRALAAAGSLPNPSACASRTTGTSSPVAIALQAQIASVNAADRAGHAATVKPQLPSLIAAAGDDPAVLSLALLAAGNVERSTGDLMPAREHLARAAREAGRAADDSTLFDALLAEAGIATDQGRPRDGLGLLDAADAVIARAHLDRAVRIAVTRGDALTQAGRIPEAIDELHRAVALLEARAARDPAAKIDLAEAIGTLAGAYAQAMDYEQARTLLLRTKSIEDTVLGPDHPEVGKTLHDLADDEARAGKFDDAMAHDRRAREIFVAAYGEHHVLVATTDLSVAGIELQQNHDEVARKLFERARQEMIEVLPPDHSDFAVLEEALGSIERDEDHCKDAIPHFQRALEIIRLAGRGGVDHAMQMTNLGACLLDTGRTLEARAAIETALQELEQAKVPLAERGEAMALMADIEDKQGHRARAIELAKQVLIAIEPKQTALFEQLRDYEREQLARWTK